MRKSGPAKDAYAFASECSVNRLEGLPEPRYQRTAPGIQSWFMVDTSFTHA